MKRRVCGLFSSARRTFCVRMRGRVCRVRQIVPLRCEVRISLKAWRCKEKFRLAVWSGPCFVIERTFADMLLASIASVLPTTNGASAAPSSAADSQDGDFHAVLASYAPVAQPAHEVAAHDTRAVKPVKAIERAAPAANQTKVSKKLGQDDEKAGAKKPATDSKSSPSSQPVVTMTPQPVPASARHIVTAQPSADDDAEVR